MLRKRATQARKRRASYRSRGKVDTKKSGESYKCRGKVRRSCKCSTRVINVFLTCDRPFLLRSRPHAHLLHFRGPGFHLRDQLLEHLQALLLFRREDLLHKGRSVRKLEGMLGQIGFEKREHDFGIQGLSAPHFKSIRLAWSRCT